jgi:hypothetical protein
MLPICFIFMSHSFGVIREYAFIYCAFLFVTARKRFLLKTKDKSVHLFGNLSIFTA